MPDITRIHRKSLSPDWLVHGVLTRLGDMFDRLLGRGWKPSSSLATSELIERLKALLDAEAREDGGRAKFVPHNIRLKMQWDKFSTDSDSALKRLEDELLTATIDHINDKRYYTYAPISLQVKPDYFTSGVRLYVSFDDDRSDEREAAIDIPTGASADVPDEGATALPAPPGSTVLVRYDLAGKTVEKILRFGENSRLTIGRAPSNDLSIPDNSVSKLHASLALNREGKLIVSDRGSTNGTFLKAERIPYGKVREVEPDDVVRFGSVDVTFGFEPVMLIPEEAEREPESAGSYTVGDFYINRQIDAVEVKAAQGDVADPAVSEPGNTAAPPSDEPTRSGGTVA